MNENVIIRECTFNDIDKIRGIGQKTFKETYAGNNTEEDMKNYLEKNFSVSKIKEELQNPESKFFIVEAKDQELAYMKLNVGTAQTEQDYNNSLEVERIYVSKEYKNMHLASQLIKRAIAFGKDLDLDYIWLGVWENNTKAIGFYEKMGFQKFGSHVFVLGNDEQTDYLMKLPLK